jgi:hypothetical protein
LSSTPPFQIGTPIIEGPTRDAGAVFHLPEDLTSCLPGGYPLSSSWADLNPPPGSMLFLSLSPAGRGLGNVFGGPGAALGPWEWAAVCHTVPSEAV